MAVGLAPARQATLETCVGSSPGGDGVQTPHGAPWSQYHAEAKLAQQGKLLVTNSGGDPAPTSISKVYSEPLSIITALSSKAEVDDPGRSKGGNEELAASGL